jgi:hypothetical protein
VNAEGVKLTVSKKARFAIALAVVVLLLGGLTIMTLTEAKAAQDQSTGMITSRATGGTGTGRQVTAASDIPVGIKSGGGIATVRLGDRGVDAVGKIIGDHTVVVETEQVLLDGKVWTRIPTSTVAVDIVYTNQTLSIAADTRPVFKAALGK